MDIDMKRVIRILDILRFSCNQREFYAIQQKVDAIQEDLDSLSLLSINIIGRMRTKCRIQIHFAELKLLIAEALLEIQLPLQAL